MNKLVFIKKLLYTLKREYGLALDVYRRTSKDTNYETGKQQITRSKYSIERAICLPNVLVDKYIYHLGFASRASTFTYGGIYDVNTRTVIIDVEDLPDGFKFGIDTDSIVFDKKPYTLSKSTVFENNMAYLLIVKSAEGQTASEVYNENVDSFLDLTSNVE